MQPNSHRLRLMLNLTYLHKNFVEVGFGDVLRDVLEAFQAQAKQNLQTICEAHASSNYNCIEETAHTLKGSASSIGAFRVAEVAEELEEAAEKQNQLATSQLVDELSSLVQATLSAVTIILEQPSSDRWPAPF